MREHTARHDLTDRNHHDVNGHFSLDILGISSMSTLLFLYFLTSHVWRNMEFFGTAMSSPLSLPR